MKMAHKIVSITLLKNIQIPNFIRINFMICFGSMTEIF
jgi:membrane-anchored glycerophosphoryl diester phosphodiesterase (GDPDase)